MHPPEEIRPTDDTTTRGSTSGELVIMAGAPVIYKSKRQRTVALSSSELDYMALSVAAQETLRLRHLLEELGFRDQPATVTKMDNKAAIAMSELVG
ncbi:hypothetical protein PsorP6_001884 [Peronosclerospora sorghi]|uniref:Uncharacterized protein n=1 Tax=Peronosclerospora sorghi TaxID=230839 RepID=A0ACC0WT37_9STRA|nr:hypothetical protein PsorP6_001884 [Peronosclerospora sorghi]